MGEPMTPEERAAFEARLASCTDCRHDDPCREWCCADVRRLLAAVAAERERCCAVVQALLDGDFCGSDTETLEAAVAAIRALS